MPGRPAACPALCFQVWAVLGAVQVCFTEAAVCSVFRVAVIFGGQASGLASKDCLVSSWCEEGRVKNTWLLQR